MNRVIELCSCLFLVLLLPKLAVGAVYYGDRYNTAHLGYGFSEAEMRVVDKCLEGRRVFNKKAQGKLNFFHNQRESSLRERTYGEIHGGVNLFIFAGSVSSSIQHTTSTDDLSTAITFHFVYESGSTTFEQRDLAAHFKSKECGGQFVYQIDHGQDIYLTAKLHFKSVEDYKKFVTVVKIRVLFVTKKKRKVKILEKYAKDAVFSVSVVSNGALPQPLAALVKSKKMHCKGEDIEQCMDSYYDISDYLFSDDGFIDDVVDEAMPVRSFHVKRYESSGHFDVQSESSKLPENIRSLVIGIEREYGRLVKQENRAYAFYSAESEPETKAELREAWKQAEARRQSYQTLREQCFDAPNYANCSAL